MKYLILPLLLITALLLCACGETAAPETGVTQDATQDTILQMPELNQIPVLPNEGCVMELNFAEELPAGTVLELRKDDFVVLTYTVETATQTVRLDDNSLRPDVGYSLTVNGVLQQHSGMTVGRPGSMMPPLEEIPIPSQPAIPEAPAGESNGGFIPGDSGNMSGIIISEGLEPIEDFPIGSAPPEGFTINIDPPEDIPLGSLPAEPPEISGSIEIPAFTDIPELPSEGILPGKAPHEPNPTEFRLRGGTTAFYGICPAN